MRQFFTEEWKSLGNGYHVSNYGRFKKVYKNKKERILSTWRKQRLTLVKLKIEEKSKDYNVARVVAETFIRKLNPNEAVYHKNTFKFDNKIDNLEIITRQELGKRTGKLSRQRTICLLDDDGNIKQIFKGTREAEKKLFISRQTVCDYCNNKVKKKMLNIAWAKNLI